MPRRPCAALSAAWVLHRSRVQVAAVELPIEEVLALRPGDVLRLAAPAEAGVTLYADQVPVQRAKPGRSGSRRAVQIIEPVARS